MFLLLICEFLSPICRIFASRIQHPVGKRPWGGITTTPSDIMQVNDFVRDQHQVWQKQESTSVRLRSRNQTQEIIAVTNTWVITFFSLLRSDIDLSFGTCMTHVWIYYLDSQCELADLWKTRWEDTLTLGIITWESKSVRCETKCMAVMCGVKI